MSFGMVGYTLSYYIHGIIMHAIGKEHSYFGDDSFFSHYFDSLHFQGNLLWDKYGNLMPVFGITSNLILLLSTLLIWKKKKAGYYIYLVTQITIMAIYINLRSFTPWGFWGWVYFVPNMISIGMLIMFTFHYKHLK